MVKISIEVRSGAARFDVAVQAENIQQAVSLVQERYSRGSLEVKFPVESGSFLVEDRQACTGIGGVDPPARAAA